MEIKMRMPGTCGEMVQGVYKGRPFLVTCPIDCYTMVTVSDEFSGMQGLGAKSNQMLQLVLGKLGVSELPYGLRLESDIPVGKGMASSSADICAVAMAVFTAYGVPLYKAQDDIMQMATSIEPTDAVYTGYIEMHDYLTGQRMRTFLVYPKLRIMIFDTGGIVDTVDFPRDSVEYTATMQKDIENALVYLENGIIMNDPAEMGRACTLSAKVNDNFLPKRHLKELINFSKRLGAVGVNVAHTGTVMGVMWSENMSDEDLLRKLAFIQARFPDLEFVRLATMHMGVPRPAIDGKEQLL